MEPHLKHHTGNRERGSNERSGTGNYLNIHELCSGKTCTAHAQDLPRPEAVMHFRKVVYVCEWLCSVEMHCIIKKYVNDNNNNWNSNK